MKRSVSAIYRIFTGIGIFSIAMGVLEAIVVVYLRGRFTIPGDLIFR